MEPLGELLGGLDDSEGGLLVIWDASWVDLGASWSALGASWRALGASWTSLGDLMARSGEHLGGFRRSFLKRFAEILKNLQKHCKVLQKSRFGGS